MLYKPQTQLEWHKVLAKFDGNQKANRRSNAPRTSKRLTQGLRILQGLGIPIKSRIHALSRHLTHLRIHLTQSRCQILTETKSIHGVLITSFHFTSRILHSIFFSYKLNWKNLLFKVSSRDNIEIQTNYILTQRPFEFFCFQNGGLSVISEQLRSGRYRLATVLRTTEKFVLILRSVCVTFLKKFLKVLSVSVILNSF